jgi:hypothetical protein
MSNIYLTLLHAVNLFFSNSISDFFSAFISFLLHTHNVNKLSCKKIKEKSIITTSLPQTCPLSRKTTVINLEYNCFLLHLYRYVCMCITVFCDFSNINVSCYLLGFCNYVFGDLFTAACLNLICSFKLSHSIARTVTLFFFLLLCLCF